MMCDTEVKPGCLTPNAIFHIYIHPRSVVMSFDMSRSSVSLHLTRDEAIALENQLHSVVEKVMAPFFKIERP